MLRRANQIRNRIVEVISHQLGTIEQHISSLSPMLHHSHLHPELQQRRNYSRKNVRNENKS